MRLWIALSALLVPATSQAAACKDELAIWPTEEGGVRNVVYQAQTDGSGQLWPDMFFEEWRGGKLAWRALARTSCSNGHSICRVSAPDGLSLIGESTTDAIIERIDEDEDGLAEWVIFAGFGQSMHYAGGLQVEWFNGFGEQEQETRISPPNQYKYFGCQTELSPAEKARLNAEIELMRRPLFALPELCVQAKGKAQLRDLTPDAFNDGIWWTRGRKIVGWEYDCVIRDIKEGVADIHCDMGGYGVWDESPSWRETEDSVEISHGEGKVMLSRCQ